ncbi:hypothetical protein GCM10009641_67560 [Mycobacterium cookii]|uniref:Uncharacterized protein n=1 Tax=Mycobacterium cookii TaxID=1775 RepID=A0A7I7KPX7_9MYCO|nr:hypothetical protein MCOO_01600 [Mycobacterium cookii]
MITHFMTTPDQMRSMAGRFVFCQEFITVLGRNFQVTYEEANALGSKVQNAGNIMADTDSAVDPSWA